MMRKGADHKTRLVLKTRWQRETRNVQHDNTIQGCLLLGSRAGTHLRFLYAREEITPEKST